eukprot:2258028-Amphidinium_carterae.3
MHGRWPGAGGVRSSLQWEGCKRAHASCQDSAVARASGRLLRQRHARRPAPASTARWRRCACVFVRDIVGASSVCIASGAGKAAGSTSALVDGAMASR